MACGRSLKDSWGRGRTSKSLSDTEAKWESYVRGEVREPTQQTPTRRQGNESPCFHAEWSGAGSFCQFLAVCQRKYLTVIKQSLKHSRILIPAGHTTLIPRLGMLLVPPAPLSISTIPFPAGATPVTQSLPQNKLPTTTHNSLSQVWGLSILASPMLGHRDTQMPF